MPAGHAVNSKQGAAGAAASHMVIKAEHQQTYLVLGTHDIGTSVKQRWQASRAESTGQKNKTPCVWTACEDSARWLQASMQAAPPMLPRLPTCTFPAATASSTPRAQKIWLTASTTMAGHSRTQEVRGRVTYACMAATTCTTQMQHTSAHASVFYLALQQVPEHTGVAACSMNRCI
jgi:hypothetical protein